MFINRRMRLISFIALFAILIYTISGVFATWDYATGGITDKKDTLNIMFFPWEGEDILPEEDGGYNQLVLVENLLNGSMIQDGVEIGIGLNNPDSDINTEIAEREARGKTTFGSMDAWDSEQMDAIFGLKAANLSFMFYFVDDTTKYLFTTGVNLGENSILFGNPNYASGTLIYPIYRTILKYQVNGINEDGSDKYEWVAVKTVLGTAPSTYYDNDYAGSLIVKSPAFDPVKFAPLKQEDCETGETAVMVGNKTNNNIYLYPDQKVDYVCENETAPAYFSVKPGAGTITIMLDADCLDAQVNVYSNNAYSREYSSTTENGATTFTARANTTYYIKITGVKDLGFNLYKT